MEGKIILGSLFAYFVVLALLIILYVVAEIDFIKWLFIPVVTLNPAVLYVWDSNKPIGVTMAAAFGGAATFALTKSSEKTDTSRRDIMPGA